MDRISIPVWYDWEDFWKNSYKEFNIFQFQYGTIESDSLIIVLALVI